MSDHGTPESEAPPGRGTPWVIAQSFLMAMLVAAGPWSPGTWHHPVGLVVGAALFTLGGAIGVSGVVRLGRNRTPFPRPRPDSILVDRGIYRWVRHPLYLSVILSGLGWALLWQSLAALLFALALLPFFDAKARHEERWLRNAFPGYTAYARRVRRFIPGVY